MLHHLNEGCDDRIKSFFVCDRTTEFKIAFELSGSNNDNLSPGLVVKFLF